LDRIKGKLLEAAMRQLACIVLLALLPEAAIAACKQVKAESDIVGIRLGDEESSARVLGDPDKLQLVEKNASGAGDMPQIRFATSDGRQQVTLYHHYGDVVGSFNEIEVRPSRPETNDGKRLPFKAFATERGVQLGISEQALTEKLGSCFRRTRGRSGETVIVYEITDPAHALLQRVNMPSYYAHYAFKGGGKLIWFKFGFEYP
jgi:hypothetical protein